MISFEFSNEIIIQIIINFNNNNNNNIKFEIIIQMK